jgi:methylenetetrahydrofolate reductase (NADPH)
LNSNKLVVTAEIVPPVSCDARELLAKIEPLKGAADAVNVTDGAGARSHMGSLAAALLLLQSGLEPILQMTCRDRNRIALQSDLLAAAALGIKNVLFMKGDAPSAGDQPQAKPVFDLDSRALIEVARRIRDDGELMNGKKVSGRADLFIGAADVPLDPPPGWRPVQLKAKVDAGAQFVQTQICMDAGVAERYAQCLADNGLGHVHLLIGIVRLRSARSARWVRDRLAGSIVPDAVVDRLERAADPMHEGGEICLELVERLTDLPHVAGVHIMAPGNEAGLAEVVAKAARVAHQKARKQPAQSDANGRSWSGLFHSEWR